MADLTHTAECIGGKGEVRFANKLLELRRVREMGAKSAEHLEKVVGDTKVAQKHRIAAARALLVYHQYREERFDKKKERDPLALLKELLGDGVALLEWMDKTRPLVEAKLHRERAAKLLTNGVNHDGRDGEGAGPEGHGDSR